MRSSFNRLPKKSAVPLNSLALVADRDEDTPDFIINGAAIDPYSPLITSITGFLPLKTPCAFLKLKITSSLWRNLFSQPRFLYTYEVWSRLKVGI
jgi:hypothetical protein